MRKWLIIWIIITSSIRMVSAQSGDEILKKVDQNTVADTKIVISKMVIHGRRSSRTIVAKSWIEKREKSFTEYLSPPREKGTKMLKLKDQLWIYFPSTDRIIKISGHMLRQSVMGSDLSYEDMMEDPELHKIYSATVVGEETYRNRPCWTLKLTASVKDVAYHTRKVWVDKERFIILKEERFAKSGKLLKTTDITEVMQVEGRWIPKKIIFKDELKKGKGTEFIMEEIQLNAKIPSYIFSKAALKK